jgi:hypothetical protein
MHRFAMIAALLVTASVAAMGTDVAAKKRLAVVGDRVKSTAQR